MLDAINMLTLTMRREHENSKGDGYTRQRSRDNNNTSNSASATGGDEFVDILQVQQLLLDGAVSANGGRNRGRGPPPPPHPHPNAPADGRGRILDSFPPPTYYYGGYTQHHSASAASVDDLVALWFAGPSPGVCLIIQITPKKKFRKKIESILKNAKTEKKKPSLVPF